MEELLQLVERNRRVAEVMAEMQRRYGGYDALASARERFWALGLDALQPLPGQPSDSAINCGGTIITKRSNPSMHFYGRCTEIIKERWGTRIRVALNCREASPAALRKAFARVDKVTLRQMRNVDLRPGGCILSATVGDDSVVELSAVVVDPDAARKVAERVYVGCMASVDDTGEITDVSLVDSPIAFEKASGGPALVAKLYDGSVRVKDKDKRRAKRMARINGYSVAENYAYLQKVQRASAAPLWPSAEAALREVDRTELALKSANCSDRAAAAAQNARARNQIGVELIKAIRSNPHNRLGGPRHTL
jgi:hypothetical protein